MNRALAALWVALVGRAVPAGDVADSGDPGSPPLATVERMTERENRQLLPILVAGSFPWRAQGGGEE